LIVPVNRKKQDFVGQERQFIDKAVDSYFAVDHAGIRCYRKKEKIFDWANDVWPFYR
jgi:hypothetical protein